MVKHTQVRRVIDLHCDTLTECLSRGVGLISREMPHFSLDRLPDGLRWCQCMAVFMPDELRGEEAERYYDRVVDVYRRQTVLHKARLTPVQNAQYITAALDDTPFASVLTVEGGSALGGKLEHIQKLYDDGVRMMTLTWNAANELAGGVATDEGFTPFGRRAVAEMERLGMAVDVSHLSDRSFWELCEFAQKPFAASHSNARSVCAHRRNLTDEMFQEIVSRGGIVGINYADHFLAEGGNASVEDILRHIHHFLALGGENTIALGSDFDGANLPADLNGLDRIGVLIDALVCSGIPEATVEKILFQNANRFLIQLEGDKSDAIHQHTR